ncbi:MAG: sugar ABC transporter ATP-binding protein [Candidatus Limnocylindrales bacterium]
MSIPGRELDAPGPIARDDTPPVLELRGLVKSFGAVRALAGVDLVLRPGAVHALVGENGAGKSTCIAIAAGVHQPDEGEIRVHGRATRFAGPAAAEAAGVSVVYQEQSLIPDLDVAQNLYLHREPRRGPFLDHRSLHRMATAHLASLGIPIEARAPVRGLSVAERQLVEIAKALSRDAALVIMDEPTASLTSVEQEHLFRVIRRLRAEGRAVLYVSHRLDEIFAISDTVTVLKDGRLVRTMPTSTTDHRELVSLMVGREHLADMYPVRPSSIDRSGTPRISIRDATSVDPERGITAISLDAWPGEIVGLAGLIGSGRTTLFRTIVGVEPGADRRVTIDGMPVPASPRAAIDAGIGFVTEDRKHEGLALDLTNLANLVSTTLPSRHGMYQRSAAGEVAATSADRVQLPRRVLGSRSGTLSGGNQQRVVIGKWLAIEPRVLLCDEPTRGIDVGAKAELHALLRRLAASGMAILFASSELPEVLGVADRILVLRAGRLVAELPAGASEEDVMRAAAMDADTGVAMATAGGR